MYMLTEVEKVVRIPPKDLKDDIDLSLIHI